MGGLLIWMTVVIVIFVFWLTPLNFLSRSETWLPLFTLVIASLVGLVDDVLVVKGWGKYIGGGISFKKRLLIEIK
jgi:UDP-N-acetylmuramyl pentapeptide phosphotransferase/UDP-N-acetylglucosamine-1-phosphate transferase